MPICPMVVRLASNTGNVGLICSKSRDASSSAPGPFSSNVRTRESSFTSTSEIPARLCAHCRIESVVRACAFSSGPESSVRARVRSTMLLASAEIREAESDSDPKSYPAPLKAWKASSSSWPILFLGRLLTNAFTWSSIGPTACGIVVSCMAITDAVVQIRRRIGAWPQVHILLAHRGDAQHIGLQVRRDLGRSAKRQRRFGAVRGKRHRSDLANLHSAVGHVGEPIQTTGRPATRR